MNTLTLILHGDTHIVRNKAAYGLFYGEERRHRRAITVWLSASKPLALDLFVNGPGIKSLACSFSYFVLRMFS